MKKFVVTLVVIATAIIIVLVLGPFYIISEGEQSVIVRFGQIVEVETEAGLHFKIPVIDNVVKYSKKILSWDGDPRRIPTAENQFIWIDTTARWRIVDPQLFYSSTTTMEQAYSRLDDVIESAVRTTIAENTLSEAVRNSNLINTLERRNPFAGNTLSEDGETNEGLQEIQSLLTVVERQPEIEKGRRRLSQNMLTSAIAITPSFGIELLDIVIRQIRYSDDLTESVYNRMISARKQNAQAYRSYGEGRKQQLLGQLENDKRAILSEAYQKSEIIKGEADAKAAQLYTTAYRQSPNFFEFWRAVESYRKVIPNFNKVLTTDMDYFRYLYNEDGQ